MGVGLIVPGDALLIVAGTTAGSPPEVLALIAAGVVACVAGASGGHWAGRTLGPRLRHGRLGRGIGEPAGGGGGGPGRRGRLRRRARGDQPWAGWFSRAELRFATASVMSRARSCPVSPA
ncbi:DedA family protein [Nonomuraea recticatena]|uniref:DedA family protein n=1 Tax=Nonomuraea recticatena TaxID=46178 RepID=A0ABN3SG42_9ACTN